MADQREIIITIKNDTGGSIKEESANPSSESPSGSDGDLDREVAGISIMANTAFNGAIEITKNVLWYNYEKHLSLADDYIGQRNLAITRAKVSVATSFVSATATGAAVGFKVGGGVGALVGALIGGGTNAIMPIANAQIELYQQNIRIQQMDAQLSYTRQRTGFSLNSGSIGYDL